MSLRSHIRAASLGAVVAILGACGGSDAFAPEIATKVVSSAQASSVELLINISSPTLDEGNPPTFSLSTLPATTSAGAFGRWTRTIPIVSSDPFAPSVAVDYGTGAGPQSVTVDQEGGEMNPFTGEVAPVSYSFRLTRAYTAPGTYVMRVGAQTTQGKRIRQHTITVTEDLSVYMDSVVVFGPELDVRGGTIEAGQPIYFRWWWRGPAEGVGSTSISHGDGSTGALGDLSPGTASSSHTWAEAGTYTLRLITTVGAKADTFSVPVVVGAAPLVCEAGSYLFEGACKLAPAGTYVPEAGAEFPYSCAPGTYQNLQGQTSCKPAPAGYYVPVAGSEVPYYCEAGRYQDETGQADCKPAPAGTYVAVGAATAATPCAVGTYQDQEGQRACLPAPVGTFVATTGAIAATSCPIGTYQDQAGQASCIAAPVGSYVSTIGATTATACPTGSTTLATGSTSASDCVTYAQVLEQSVSQAVANGTLTGIATGKRGSEQLAQWQSELSRSLRFLNGPQRMAGCRGLRNQLAQADGLRAPADQVSGAALPQIRALLVQLLDENGCGR